MDRGGPVVKIPERLQKYPLISLAVIVGIALVTLYAVADVLGPEWVAEQIEWALGSALNRGEP